MIDLIVLFMQIFIDLIVGQILYFGIDYAVDRAMDRDGCSYGCASYVVFAVLGGLFGVGMNIMHPGLFTPWPGAQVAGLFIWPPFAGVIAYGMAYCWRYRAKSANHWPHFWNAFLFVLGFNLIRFMYGAR